MSPRINYVQKAPWALEALLGLQTAVNEKSGLETGLLQLVEMRASQINGCAYCLNMHSREARHRGESERRLYLLDAWRETDDFSARERAALAWTEAVTEVAGSRVPDAVYEEARREFSEAELIGLTLAIIAINGWNRVNVAFRTSVDRQPVAAKG